MLIVSLWQSMGILLSITLCRGNFCYDFAENRRIFGIWAKRRHQGCINGKQSLKDGLSVYESIQREETSFRSWEITKDYNSKNKIAFFCFLWVFSRYRSTCTVFVSRIQLYLYRIVCFVYCITIPHLLIKLLFVIYTLLFMFNFFPPFYPTDFLYI